MVEEKHESTRNLLAQIEGEWDSPKPPAVEGAPGRVVSPTTQAALDAAADRLVDDLEPMPISVPTMDELDSGWGEEEDDDEEEDEVEPELPDERLDPVAYAAAKKARDERIEARRVRRRAKAEAKKARRQARVEAQKQKQKGKQKKARTPNADARATAKANARSARRAAVRATSSANAEEADELDELDELDTGKSPARAVARAKAPPSRLKVTGRPSTNQWMLGIAIAVFVAAAIFAAVVTR